VRRRPTTRVAVLAAAMLVATACGDDDENEAAVAEERLITAVENYSQTVVEGDPDAVVHARSKGCAVVDTDLEADAGRGTPRDVEVEIDGERASVDYRLDPGGEVVEDERWVLEDGEWRWDNC